MLAAVPTLTFQFRALRDVPELQLAAGEEKHWVIGPGDPSPLPLSLKQLTELVNSGALAAGPPFPLEEVSAFFDAHLAAVDRRIGDPERRTRQGTIDDRHPEPTGGIQP